MKQIIADKIDKFFAQYPLRRFKTGHILIYANEDPQFIYYLTSGTVRVYDINQHGSEIEVLTYKPPAFFPMSWAINKTPNEYFYAVEGAVSIRQASVDDSLKFLKDNEDVLLDLLGRVYKGTDVILRRMAHMMGGNAKNRVLFELVLESHRVTKKDDGTYSLGLSESSLATKAGLTRETVSRVMKELKSKALVKVSRNNIVVLDLDSLVTKLGHLL